MKRDDLISLIVISIVTLPWVVIAIINLISYFVHRYPALAKKINNLRECIMFWDSEHKERIDIGEFEIKYCRKCDLVSPFHVYLYYNYKYLLCYFVRKKYYILQCANCDNGLVLDSAFTEKVLLKKTPDAPLHRKYGGAITVSAFLIFILMSIKWTDPIPQNNNNISASKITPKPSKQTEVQKSYTYEELNGIEPLPKPNNNHLFFLKKKGYAPLKVTAPENENYYIRVDDWKKNKAIAAFFVRGGHSAEISLPVGSYKLMYAFGGDKWYGEQHLFGLADTYYEAANERLDFIKTNDGYKGISVELTLRPHGNLHSKQLTREEFLNSQMAETKNPFDQFDPPVAGKDTK